MTKSKSVQVFKVNQVGDAVCFLPVLQKLLASEQVGPLHVWTTPAARPILDCHPSIQLNTLPLQEFNGAWKKPNELYQIIRTTRKIRPDACLLDWDQGNVAHLAAATSGAKHLFGGTNTKVQLNRFLLNKPAQPPHITIAQWCWNIGKLFAEKVLQESWEATPPIPDLTHLTGFIHPPSSNSPILIHPGASREYQRWPLERYFELAAQLARTRPVQLVQPRELPPFDAPPGVEVIAPSTLAELAQYIASSSLLVGNNSGPMNFAFALGVPSVIFWGPTNPVWKAQWLPERHLSLVQHELPCIACDTRYHDYQCHNAQEPFACMRRWQISDALNACLKWLDRWPPPCRSQS